MILSHKKGQWSVLLKLDVHKELMELMKSFHHDRIRVNGELLEEFEVTNGLRQGYTMALI